MYRLTKSVAAISLAVVIGCVLPMGTMMAAEEDVGTVQEIVDDSVSGNGIVSAIEAEVSATEAAVSAEEQQTDAQIDVQSENSNSAAPVIEIKWQGQNWTCGLGGKIDYKYINPYGQGIACTADQDGQAVTLYQRLDSVSDITAEAKGEGEMESLFAGINGEQSLPVQVIPPSDGSYVLYVKAVGADGQTAYARSNGIVVDTKAPVVKGVEEGKSYPEGTLFQVEDDNLDSVTVNGKLAVPEADESYRVLAEGSSCVIKVKDKAGNETTCSITIPSKDPEADGNIISVSGLYALKAGTKYQLSGERWQLDGDNTVYRSGVFYVKTDGNYRFTKW